MTPTIDVLLKRLRRFQFIIVLCLSLCAFSVITSLVLGIYFFGYKRNLSQLQASTIEKIQALDATQNVILDFQQKWSTQKLQSLNEIQISGYFEAYLVVREKMKIAQLEFELSPVNVSITPPHLNLQSILTQLAARKQTEINTLHSQLAEFNSTIFLLIYAGLGTLFFGILLPLLAFYLATRMLNNLRLQIQNSVVLMIRTWAETKAGFGDDAFLNVDFWLQTVFMLGQFAVQLSSHPAAILVGEMTYLIREELQKNSKKKVDA